MGGILFQAFGWSIEIPLAALALQSALAVHHRHVAAYLCTSATLFCWLAFGGGTLLHHKQQCVHQQFSTRLQDGPIHLRGKVTDIAHTDHRRMRYCITVCSDELCHENCIEKTWESAGGYNVQLYLTHQPRCNVGDSIEVQKIRFSKPKNESFARYLIKQGITATTLVEAWQMQVITKPAWSFQRAVWQMRERVYEQIRDKMSRADFALFSSLFLGNKSAVKRSLEQTRRQFNCWGIAHYLARSGLHLLIFITLITFLLSYIPLPWWLKQSVIVFLVTGYALLSWPSTSFARALIVALLYKCSQLINLATHALHLVLLACLFILLFNPIQLFFLDFQLSFGLTCALAWLNHVQAQRKAVLAQNH